MRRITGKGFGVHMTGVHTCLNCEKEMNTPDLGKLLCSIECLLEIKECAAKQGVESNYDLDDVKGLFELRKHTKDKRR
jgi:hypothetical protein